ncbi:hypothetical protein BX600DRAFT_283889 [Xylariales sp. PMI_506]|nr:hypothetical protein BX600DRAFT_283889 [Xylariales sp. PMI_506]
MQSDLAILSAEQYEDGHGPRRASGGKTRKSSLEDEAPAPKKRTRAQLSEDGEADEKKRSRGRPRLDPKDDTAQERRRTQIRLAQRAYRSRKENAISTLEKQVDSLKDVTEQMSEAYRDLFDYATRKGLLEQAPEFGQRLMRLQAIAKRSTEKDDEDVDSSDGNGANTAEQESRKPGPKPPARNASKAGASKEQQPQHLWGGLLVAHEPDLDGSDDKLSGSSGSLSTSQVSPPSGYEVIAQPTAHNATFTSLSFDEYYFPTNAWVPSLYDSLSIPKTYAFHEGSFSRRLHRVALENAAKLLTMRHPPPDKIMRVFGLARLFETLDQIKERTLAALAQAQRESLYRWDYHVLHVNGAGMQFPGEKLNRINPFSNRPKDPSPFPMGPSDQRISKIQNSLMSLGGQINLPGWDGVFWDTDEVEYYLIHNGVEIPPTADYVTVEIQEGAFGESPSSPSSLGQADSSNETVTSSSATTVTGMSYGVDHATSTAASSSNLAPALTRISSPASQAESLRPPVSVADDIWSVIPTTGTTADIFPQSYMHSGGTPGLSAYDSSNLTAYADPMLLQYLPPISGDTGHQQSLFGQKSARKKSLRLDVEKFMRRLVSHATCLGRTPGFKPRDVDKAFWASVIGPDTTM